MDDIPLTQLRYRIIGASTEDPDNPIYSILSKTPNEGWSAVRFCFYPQEILIQFTQPIRLRQWHLLFHQTKLPSKVDIYNFFPSSYDDFFADYNTWTFEKIGYIIPDTNSKTDYKARELKKVFLNDNCLYLKLVFHKNYKNIYNTFSQVGLVSLECFGFIFNNNNIDLWIPTKLSDKYNWYIKNPDQYIATKNVDEKDLDDICWVKINKLKEQLKRAVNTENYDQAKVWNELIERIKWLGWKIKNLTDIKLKAIEVNDYDGAKNMKKEIDRIKSIIEGVTQNDFISDWEGDKGSANLNKSDMNFGVINTIKEDENENLNTNLNNSTYNKGDIESNRENHKGYNYISNRNYMDNNYYGQEFSHPYGQFEDISQNKPPTKSDTILNNINKKKQILKENKILAEQNLEKENEIKQEANKKLTSNQNQFIEKESETVDHKKGQIENKSNAEDDGEEGEDDGEEGEEDEEDDYIKQ